VEGVAADQIYVDVSVAPGVRNTQDEIRQAISDLRQGTFVR